MMIRDLMTRDPCCCLPMDSARRGAILMRRFEIGVLPVVDDECHRRLLGIVTDRDLCLGVVAANRMADEVTVEECMVRNPARCAPDDEVNHVLKVMRAYRVRRLPVVNAEGYLIGMISLTDLIRYHAATNAEVETVLEELAQLPSRR